VKRYLLALSLLVAAGCETQTKYGECYGPANEEDKSDALTYRTSTWNVVIGVIFFETVFAPIEALGWNLKCPTGHKTLTATPDK